MRRVSTGGCDVIGAGIGTVSKDVPDPKPLMPSRPYRGTFPTERKLTVLMQKRSYEAAHLVPELSKGQTSWAFSPELTGPRSAPGAERCSRPLPDAAVGVRGAHHGPTF